MEPAEGRVDFKEKNYPRISQISTDFKMWVVKFPHGQKICPSYSETHFFVTREFSGVLPLVFACQVDGLLGEEVGQDKHRQNAGFSKGYLLFYLYSKLIAEAVKIL